MFETAVRRLRVIGLVEGSSFLILLLIAMPLKYAAKIPEPVLYVGWAHGVLFMLYVAAAAYAYRIKAIDRQTAALALAASVLPGGPFVLDRRLRDRPPTDSAGSTPA